MEKKHEEDGESRKPGLGRRWDGEVCVLGLIYGFGGGDQRREKERRSWKSRPVCK